MGEEERERGRGKGVGMRREGWKKVEMMEAG